MTKSTKSNELTNMTKNDIIVKAPTASQYYEDDIHSFEAHDAIFEDQQPVVVANEYKLMMKHQLLNIRFLHKLNNL